MVLDNVLLKFTIDHIRFIKITDQIHVLLKGEL